jgi:hypothetical protein
MRNPRLRLFASVTGMSFHYCSPDTDPAQLPLLLILGPAKHLVAVQGRVPVVQLPGQTRNLGYDSIDHRHHVDHAPAIGADKPFQFETPPVALAGLPHLRIPRLGAIFVEFGASMAVAFTIVPAFRNSSR